jgi:hypothetical protein
MSGAKVTSNKEFEENVKGNSVAHGTGPRPYTIEKKNIRIYLFGDTAVVTHIKEVPQTPDTTEFFDEDITDVFARTQKGWPWQFSRINAIAPDLR